MPYGIPKDKGGDSPENVDKLKRCMAEVGPQNGHLSEEELIRICKSKVFNSAKEGQPVGGQ